MMTNIFPSFDDVRTGWKHSLLLRTLKKKTIDRKKRNAFLVFIGIVYATAVLIASNAGTILLLIASTQGTTTTEGNLAISYITSVSSDEGIPEVVYLAFNSIVLLSLIVPLAGAANIPYFTDDELASVGVRRIHRFFDGIFSQTFSVISLIQLLFLVFIASMLTIDSGRIPALIISVLLWIMLVSITILEGWVVELIIRTLSFPNRMIVATGLAATLGATLWADPNHGKTLFGLAENYRLIMQNSAESDLSSVMLAMIVIIFTILSLISAGLLVCHNALAHPLPAVKKKGGIRSIKLSHNTTIALTQLLFANILRLGEIRRPVLTMILVSAPTAFLTSKNTDMVIGLLLALPLVVVLSWGVNVFGILGPALPWLRTLPNVGNKLLKAAMLSQLIIIALISVICWSAPYFTGRFTNANMLSIVFGTVVISSLLSYKSADKSVSNPHMVRLSSRGDSTIPPMLMIEYSAKFSATAGILGIITFYQDSIFLQILLTATFVLFAIVRFNTVQRKWFDPQHQSSVMNTVANI